MEWVHAGREYTLCVYIVGGSVVRLGGFKENDYSVISEYASSHFGGQKVEAVEGSARGVNYGELAVENKMVTLYAPDGKPILTFPLDDVSQSGVQGKKGDELVFDFHQDDGEYSTEVEIMQRISFYVPPTTDGETGAVLLESSTRSTTLYETVKEEGDLDLTSGDSIVLLEQLPFKTPRGRYTVELFPKYMVLRGKTMDHKILYSNVLRMYLLPTPDERSVVLSISVDPPLRQGQTRYPHLLLAFKTNDRIQVKLKIDQDEIDARYSKFATDPLVPEMEGLMYEVISRVFKQVFGKKIAKLGSFVSSAGASALHCTVGSSDGLLYPLEKSLFFIHKPAMQIRLQDIASVDFARVTGPAASSTSAKTFDFVVHTKSGLTHTFINISRDDYDKLYDYLRDRSVNVSSVRVAPAAVSDMVSFNDLDLGDEGPPMHDSEDDDDDFSGGDSEEDSLEFASDDGGDDDDDQAGSSGVGKKRKKTKPKKGKKAAAKNVVEDDEEDEDEDGDGDEDGEDDEDEDEAPPPRKVSKRAAAKVAEEVTKKEMFGSMSISDDDDDSDF